MTRRMQLLTTLALWLLAVVAHAGTVTYVYTDPQGTPLAEADASGTITARFDYAPYGQSVTSMGAAPNGPGYTGHVNDPDTGLVYMQARYYDPEVGRFLSVDPAGALPGKIFSFNRYAYASNNPIANIDPDGRDDIPFGDCSKNPNCSVDIGSGGGNATSQTSNGMPLSNVPVLGQTVEIGYDKAVSAGGQLTASDAIAAAAALINVKASLLTKKEMEAIKQITNILVTGSQSYLGAINGHTMAISIGYIKQVSTAWLASIFGHEGQHHLNGGRYTGANAWRDEESAGQTQLSIGRKIGFSRTESDYLEDYIDPISHQKSMQQHMENGYEF